MSARISLHDHPGLFPILPGRPLDEDQLELMAGEPNSEFRAAWEFVLSHRLTSAERSAFWHGVNIQHDARTLPCPHQDWETRKWSLIGDGIEQHAAYDVDDQGHVVIEESLLAQLLLDAGWERTS